MLEQSKLYTQADIDRLKHVAADRSQPLSCRVAMLTEVAHMDSGRNNKAERKPPSSAKP